MRQSKAPDAIVCGNDDLAAGAMLGLREMGIAVPTDVSVVGFDDRAFAAHLPIPLTTVALPLFEMGQRAAEKLFGALQGDKLKHEILRVPCRLVVRESCGGRVHDGMSDVGLGLSPSLNRRPSTHGQEIGPG
jgi:LacI family transcriptional regulator